MTIEQLRQIINHPDLNPQGKVFFDKSSRDYNNYTLPRLDAAFAVGDIKLYGSSYIPDRGDLVISVSEPSVF